MPPKKDQTKNNEDTASVHDIIPALGAAPADVSNNTVSLENALTSQHNSLDKVIKVVNSLHKGEIEHTNRLKEMDTKLVEFETTVSTRFTQLEGMLKRVNSSLDELHKSKHTGPKPNYQKERQEAIINVKRMTGKAQTKLNDNIVEHEGDDYIEERESETQSIVSNSSSYLQVTPSSLEGQSLQYLKERYPFMSQPILESLSLKVPTYLSFEEKQDPNTEGLSISDLAKYRLQKKGKIMTSKFTFCTTTDIFENFAYEVIRFGQLNFLSDEEFKTKVFDSLTIKLRLQMKSIGLEPEGELARWLDPNRYLHAIFLALYPASASRAARLAYRDFKQSRVMLLEEYIENKHRLFKMAYQNHGNGLDHAEFFQECTNGFFNPGVRDHLRRFEFLTEDDKPLLERQVLLAASNIKQRLYCGEITTDDCGGVNTRFDQNIEQKLNQVSKPENNDENEGEGIHALEMAKVECYNCRRKGHFSRNCRFPKKNNNDNWKSNNSFKKSRYFPNYKSNEETNFISGNNNQKRFQKNQNTKKNDKTRNNKERFQKQSGNYKFRKVLKEGKYVHFLEYQGDLLEVISSSDDSQSEQESDSEEEQDNLPTENPEVHQVEFLDENFLSSF